MQLCCAPTARLSQPPLPQVESYMAKVVDKMRTELRSILADAVGGAVWVL